MSSPPDCDAEIISGVIENSVSVTCGAAVRRSAARRRRRFDSSIARMPKPTAITLANRATAAKPQMSSVHPSRRRSRDLTSSSRVSRSLAEKVRSLGSGSHWVRPS